jgi:dTDP-N-acetylfucosamine:lipid II N-acetylfucosaminyltransferase
MDLKRVINIMPDDKFLDYYITMSEKFIPEQSSYLVFTNLDQLEYVKSINSNLFVLREDSDSYYRLANKIDANDVIVFHGFNSLHKEFIKNIPSSVKKVWIFWGYEGYAAIPFTKYILPSSIRKVFPKGLWGSIMFCRFYMLNLFVRKRSIISRELIQQMDYCATWVDQDIELAKRFNPALKSMYFNYYTKELMNFGEIKNNSINKNRIFLGNSANYSNHHIEALKYLYEINFSGEIICPLSYSGAGVYVDNIVELGREMFGDRFIPLLNFISLQEYQEIINSCGIVWMNHIRQQAAGNLFAAFCSGKVVILDDRNPMIDTFSKWGLHYFKKQDLLNLNVFNERFLEKNRAIILNKIVINANKSFFKNIKAI